MPDRWIARCRRAVPAPLRGTCFDPSVADLQNDWASRPGGPPGRLARRYAIARLAWQCRRLAPAASIALHESGSTRLSFVERTVMTVQVFRLAARRLLRQPAFTFAAVVTLALGIGANLAIFAFVQSVLLSPINAPEPDRLVRVAQGLDPGDTTPILSWLNYTDARDTVAAVDLAAHGPARAQVGATGQTEIRTVELVSGNYFSVLGQTALFGRLIAEGDNGAELANPVVVLSEAYWRARFAARPDVIGESLLINGAPLEIIGVAQAGFRGTFHAHASDLWTPIAMQQQVRPRGLTLESRNWGWLRWIGRLRGEATVEVAQAQLDAVAADLNRRFPTNPAAAIGFIVRPASALADNDREVLSPVLTVVLAFTAVLFLVACSNLAGVMQARLLTRVREIAIRRALGAARPRALAEWAAECVLLAAGGGLAGALLARTAVAALSRLQPPAELVGDMAVIAVFDWRVGLAAVGLSAVAALAFGLLPALRVGRGGSASTLKDESGTTSGSRSAVRLRRTAVVAQLAFSGVLLISAALLGASLVNRQAFNPGFEPGELGLLAIDLERQRVSQGEWRRLADVALERTRRDPAVRAAELGWVVPLGFGEDVMGFRIPGHTPPEGSTSFSINFNIVGVDYFRALGVRLVEGAMWSGTGGGPVEVVINQTMARRFWPGRSAVGQEIQMLGTGPVRIAGVAADTSYYEIGEDPIPYLYLPAERRMPGRFVLHVRTAGDPAPVIQQLRRGLEEADPRLAPHNVSTFETLRRAPLFPARLLVATAMAFGALAVLLAGIGLYGVMTLSVSQRTREIGVRMALGARPGQVIGGVFREALRLVAFGLGLAFPAGYLAAGALSGWLFGVSPFAPGLYAGVAVFLLAVACLAAWYPARRASRIDPVLALRT
jgi:putative ABC transport system permease protein